MYFLLGNTATLNGLYLVLFGLVFLLLIVLMVLTLMKKKYLLTILLSGFVAFVTSMGVTSFLTRDTTVTTEAAVEEFTKEEDVNENKNVKKEETDSSTDSVKKISEFKPTEMKYPIVIYESQYDSYKEYQDADGTIYRNMTMVNPDGVMMGTKSIDEAIVASPIDNPNNDEFAYYQGYHYYKGSYHFTVSEANFKYGSRDAAAPYYKEYIPLKTEEYSNMDMQLYDFIYKFMPLQFPDEDKIVEVPLLEGEWVAYEDTIMEGSKVLAKMDFSNDGFLLMENNIVNTNEIPSNIHFKLEHLDENSYKLYLYHATIKADSNGGGITISEEPSKRNFIIYVTSEDAFELVYYDYDLKRNSITMNRL